MNVSLITKKIKTAYEVSTNAELAIKLGVSVSAIEAWSRRKEIPQKYIFQCTAETGVSIEWLLDEDKPTFHISGGTGNVSQQNLKGVARVIYNNSEKENEINSFDENDPVILS